MQEKPENSTLANQNAMYAFYLKAIVMLAVLLGFYYGWLLDSVWYSKLLAFIVEYTTHLLNTIGLEHSVAFDRLARLAEIRTDVGGGIVGGGFVLINKSCDAYLETALMLAAMLAWPGNIGKKLVFALLGIALMTSLNLLRIAALVVIDHFWPLYFPMMNQWGFPAVMIAAALAYFYLWVRVSRVSPVG